MISVRYKAVARVRGPLIFAKGIPRVKMGEIVKVHVGEELRTAQVLEIAEDITTMQVFEGTEGITRDTSLSSTGETLSMPTSTELLGRILDGRGRPIDGGPAVSGELREISGFPVNPVMREYPRHFVETGISAIDGVLSLIRGQKLPIFTGGGLPHNEVASQIARQSSVLEEEEDFAVVFCAVGVTHEDASFFLRELEDARAAGRLVGFINLAEDPTVERLTAPRFALTAAEYLAFDESFHVLVILLDMTNYCEALREISAAMGEMPGRRAYPGYMYTDLASIYERAGRIKGSRGSITQIPIVSMPDMDITHPVPDLTGFITEGQVVMSQSLFQRGIYPPIDVLPSLSRLMKDGVGENRTRGDHMDIADRLYSAYSKGRETRDLALVVGEGSLTSEERRYLRFADRFEKRFISQGRRERRGVEQTLALGLEVLSVLEEE